VAQWGVDDSFIVKWALETLGLTERIIVPLADTQEEVAPETEGE
jgi:hypothetical protein